jgi:antirestriction protein ArdC
MTVATGDRASEALSRLAEGIGELTSSRAWQEYLDAARHFHNYSFSNTMLIYGQMKTASHVAGFHAWRKLGRNVRRGEHAIWILAPVTRRRSEDDEATVDEGPKRRVAIAFRAVPVFDITQTEGEPLPEVTHRLSGDDTDDAFNSLKHVAMTIGYSVSVDELPGERNGDTTFAERRIRVRHGLAPMQMVKTLCHELAHALLHDGFTGSRDLAECEAESVAYVVCDGLGLDSSAYSFGYVAGWAGGGDEAAKAITASGTRIQQAAKQILEALNSQVPALA